jgi:uncharacterized protein (TIGR03382 family)
MRRRCTFTAMVVCLAAMTAAAHAQADPRPVTFRFVPTKRAQIAVWVESADGTRFATVRLTDAVARRGIGNRPGASQMNSGYHWPYGRREGVLPVWAHRRAAVPGAMLFPRVIFQNRPEGWASRACEDSTREDYYCLSFIAETTRRDGLDAISCASVFNGDKGRLITPSDVANGYSEPFVEAGVETTRALDGSSLYPPRRDVVSCANASVANPCMNGSGLCPDHPDSALYVDRARAAMPEIDAVTMATPPGDQPTAVVFDVPPAWPDGDYFASLEINTEGDYNASYNETVYPTPKSAKWDSWAMSYGYPFRGQPSVVFRVAIHLGTTEIVSTSEAFGYGSLSGIGPEGGTIKPMDATISDDPATAPGSGVDRLKVTGAGYRLRVEVGPSPSDGGAGADAAADASPPDGAAEDASTGTDAAVDAADGPGPTEPLCIPGMTVACACVGGGQGAQTCAADGKRYELCRCPEPVSMKSDGCDCSCDVGGGGSGPLGLLLAAVLLRARRARANRTSSAGRLDGTRC